MIEYVLLAAVFGVLMSGAEVFARYKDEPLKAVRSSWGAGYLVFNSLLSALAFWIVILVGAVAQGSPQPDKLKWAVVAGFGAGVVMRTKLFSVRSNDGGDISFGPDFVISTALHVMDRQIDRRRAIERYETVTSIMHGIDFGLARSAVLISLNESMQNLLSFEKEEVALKIKGLEGAANVSDQEKANALGYLMVKYGGEAFFRRVFAGVERSKYVAGGKSKDEGDSS